MNEGDRASALEQHALAQDLAKQAEHFNQVETPDTDEAGNRVCLDCEIIIPAKRLEVYPQAVRCVDCQEVVEIMGSH